MRFASTTASEPISPTSSSNESTYGQGDFGATMKMESPSNGWNSFQPNSKAGQALWEALPVILTCGSRSWRPDAGFSPRGVSQSRV